MYVYYIRNKKNGMGYVGQTNNMTTRMRTHFNTGTIYADTIFQAEGKENFDIKIVFTSDNQNEINEKEKYYIKKYNTLYPNGYNIAEGGVNNFLGGSNPQALITTEEAQWIVDNRDKTEKDLYVICPFKDRITYRNFCSIYRQETWSHLVGKSCTVNNLSHKGEESGNHTYTNQEVYDIREDFKNGVYFEDSWIKHGSKGSLSSFYNIYLGKGYKNVHYDVYTEENYLKHRPDRSGENNGRAKLTVEDVKKIREIYGQTKQYTDLYKMYPQVSKTSIRNVCLYKTWKNI